MAAEGMQFSRWWNGDTISLNLEFIWGMSAKIEDRWYRPLLRCLRFAQLNDRQLEDKRAMDFEVDWTAKHYDQHGRFISMFGLELLPWLDPQPGQRILDLGCGDGFLAERIAQSGAEVIGVDTSDDMLSAARARGIHARRINALAMPFESEFDAVFSNSVLQWIRPPERVVQGIARALKPSGRFVTDLGALGNLAAVLTALRAVGDQYGGDPSLANPFYSPTPEEFRFLLESNGFAVDRVELVPRLTPMPTNLLDWIGTIFGPFFNQFEQDRRNQITTQVLDLLRPVLCDANGQWHADHVRLRAAATLLD